MSEIRKKYPPCAATNYLKGVEAGPGVPEEHSGSSNTASVSMEAQSECALRVVVRRAALQRRRLADRRVLEMGRIGRS